VSKRSIKRDSIARTRTSIFGDPAVYRSLRPYGEALRDSPEFDAIDIEFFVIKKGIYCFDLLPILAFLIVLVVVVVVVLGHESGTGLRCGEEA
jgi:hypothetical protein